MPPTMRRLIPLLILVPLPAQAPQASAQPRPNILFVMTDDQRNDMMGCAGHPLLKTPTMDALAARGVRYENAFVTTAICAASRATVLTGTHRIRHGFTFGTPPLSEELCRQSYPYLLRKGGYRTALVGKLGVKLHRGMGEEMFDLLRPMHPNPYVDKQGRHLSDRIADAAIRFIGDGGAKQPFCLSISFNAPHAKDPDKRQYIWPPDLDELYAEAEIPAPPLAEPEFFNSLPEFLRKSMSRDRWYWRFDTEARRVAMTKGYYRMITGLDRATGRVLQHLDQLGLTDNTVVIFTSDNGYFLGGRGFAGKWYLYESSVRIPLIIADPRLDKSRQGVTESRMVTNEDFAPTILALAGVAPPPRNQGRDLGPLNRGEPVADWRREFCYAHLFRNKKIPKSRGVRGQRYVYINYFEQKPPHEELYDLQEDPLQRHNLARKPEHRARLEALRKRCEELTAAQR